MKSSGIRILDKIQGVVYVNLPEILEEIHDGESLHWSILYLDAVGDLGDEISIPDFEEEIYNLERGLFIKWDALHSMAQKFDEIVDIIIIGCKDPTNLRRYEDDREKYETCDVVIEMVDSGYWEVFSKDKALIDRLAAKFKDTIPLAPDFEKQFGFDLFNADIVSVEVPNGREGEPIPEWRY